MNTKRSTMRPVVPADPAAGFILVAVLLLIALVTVLVVVTSLLARVERNAVASETNTELARQNALFGLDVALAQLQKQAGPDQRITARADILDTNPSTVAVEGFKTPSQAYWTGVWKTGNASPDASYVSALPTPAPAATPQRTASLGGLTPTTAQKVANAAWLVSDPIDPGTQLPLLLDPTAALPASVKTIAVAKNLPDPAGSATPVNVNVPLVGIQPSSPAAGLSASPTPVGKYAFWVSDEGVKAKPNMVDPTYQNPGFVQSQLHFAAPQSVAAQDGLFGANSTDLRDPKYAADLLKVTSLQSMGYVQGTASTPAVTGVSGAGAAQFSPDVTTSSYGVLADVRNGGLKVDLSQLFEDPSNQFNAFLSSLTSSQNPDLLADQKVWEIIAPSYDAGNNMNPTAFGVRWQSLYNYYSLYKDTTTYPPAAPWSNLNSYSGGHPETPNPSLDGRLFGYTSNPAGTVGGATSLELGEYYMPHILGIGIYFSMSSKQLPPSGTNPTNPHDYSLIMYAEPRLILYNPYNVNLTVSKTSTTKTYAVSLTTNLLGRALAVSVNGTTIITQPPSWGGPGIVNDMSISNDTAANFVLKPGEIRVYGLGVLTNVSSFGRLLSFSNIGDKVGQSQWQYIGTDAGTVTFPNSTTQWRANVPDNAPVSVTFGGGSFQTNNGFYRVQSIGPGIWPNSIPLGGGNNTYNLLGRFFNLPPGEKTQTANLGPISAMATVSPDPSAAKLFGYFVIRAKGLAQSETSNSALQALPTFSSSDGAFNPLPTYFDNTMQDTDFALAVQNPTSLTEMQVSGTSPPFNSYWGSQDAALNANDPTFLVLRDVPRQPMISLGQFMHMPMRTSTRPSSNSVDTNSCLMGVGGSLADPFFALTSVWGNANGKSVADFDDNFLMNQALFDSYYFSTVPLPTASMDASYKAVLPALSTGNTAFTDANILSRTCVLPNSRMSFYAKNGVPPQTSSSTSQNYLPHYQKAAANLLLNGAFNVNSTSVAAWRALLSSLSGNNPIGGLYGNSAGFAAGQYPIFRFLSPMPITVNGVTSAVTTSASPNPWASINLLTEPAGGGNVSANASAQVTALATAIVKQVKRLGPFLSMADFLNRRLSTASDTYGQLGLKGALQAAIDDPTVNINASLLALGSGTGPGTTGSRSNTGVGLTAVAAQLPNNTAIGTPGCLMQQDLVQCFSPAMTVRSDTFLVRCYGETDNIKSGVTQGRAWGEAVVQRLPDFVDQSDPALSAGSNLGDATPLAKVSAVNQTFGRRFKVVSYRWLNESDL